MWPRDAYVGQRVVCVDDSAKLTKGRTPYEDGLRKGTIYTIRSVGVDPTWGELVLWLEEIVRKVGPAAISEVGFCTTRFKPVDESRLDIFREMLIDKNVQLREDA